MFLWFALVLTHEMEILPNGRHAAILQEEH